MEKYALLIVHWALCILPLIAALDEASIRKQLDQCVPSLIDKLKAATQKIDNCNAVETVCDTHYIQGWPDLKLRCASNADCEPAKCSDCPQAKCSLQYISESTLSCGGEVPNEVLHEFIDRWCFTTTGRQAWAEKGGRLGYPKLGFTLALGDFLAAIGKIKASDSPLPAKDALVAFTLDLVKTELKDKCGSLELVCGKHLVDQETQIRGLKCPYYDSRNELNRFNELIEVPDKKTRTHYLRPLGIAFSYKMSHPGDRMEKIAKAIYDILCPNGEKTKSETYKTMTFFKRAVEKAAAGYTIA